MTWTLCAKCAAFSETSLASIQRDIVDFQQQLTAIAEKLARSKAEVLNNVRARLSGWIVDTHQLLHTGSNQLAVYAEKLAALKRRKDVIRQVHKTPPIYATAVSEVFRRKALREVSISIISVCNGSITL